MQQNPTPAELSSLLDRVLLTSQALKRAIASCVIDVPAAVQAEEIAELPIDEPRVTPVLTIKLADLVREGNAARKRRLQNAQRLRRELPPPPARQSPPVRRQRPSDRVYREIEVIRRKSLRLVS